MKYLIFGKDGWLANKLKIYLGDAIVSDVDALDLPAIRRELAEKKPEVVINAAGITGRPNIDWCEDHRAETVAGNVTVPLNILEACQENGLYMVHFGSGCIFQGNGPDDKGFKEDDEASPPSFYSWTKFWADSILRHFPVLILRLRMPIDVEPNPRNLINKLIKYTQVWDPQNSLTVIPDLLEVVKVLSDKKKTGIYHVANPGTISPADIVELYQKIVDPGHKFEKISVEDLYSRGLAKAERSNTILNTDKLKAEGINLKPIEERTIEVMEEYKKKMKL
jgi:dTDP-4-dehydrorhamnose reductase